MDIARLVYNSSCRLSGERDVSQKSCLIRNEQSFIWYSTFRVQRACFDFVPMTWFLLYSLTLPNICRLQNSFFEILIFFINFDLNEFWHELILTYETILTWKFRERNNFVTDQISTRDQFRHWAISTKTTVPWTVLQGSNGQVPFLQISFSQSSVFDQFRFFLVHPRSTLINDNFGKIWYLSILDGRYKWTWLWLFVTK